MARWAATYSKFGGQDALPHLKRVLDASIAHCMVEPEKIGDRAIDPRQLNLKLANVIMAHVFRRSKTNKRDFHSEDFERHQLVVEGFNTFDALRENDLGHQDPHVYGSLLQTPSLGLLARMVDLTQYGRDGQASEHELSGLDPAVFYFFDSKTGKTEYEHVALAARKVYSPLADLFGYRRLAGDLMEIVYYNLHRSIYEDVNSTLSLLTESVESTRRMMAAAIVQLDLALRSQGYKFDILARENKHHGKVMEKAHRYSMRDGRSVSRHVAELHDLVAFTVVLHSRNGKMVTQNDLPEFENAARIIVDTVKGITPLRKGLTGREVYTDMITNPKANGYQSFHVDLSFESRDLVCLEAIVRNTRMHQYSERGGAAHFLYKGGGEEARTVERAYRDVKNAIESGSQPSISVTDSSSYRRIRFYVQGEDKPRVRVVPSGACIGEALICADVDLTNGLILYPKRSLLEGVEGIAELKLVHASEKGDLISASMIDELIRRAVLEQTRERLVSMKRSLSGKR
jgi:hypothetical protein